MFYRKLALLLIGSLGFAFSTASAQSDARIRGALPSIEHVEKDLQWLIELSPSADLKKQWKKLKEDVFDAFTDGVDLSKPVEVDLVFRKDQLGYEFRIPIAKLVDKKNKNGFLDSLVGAGYIVKPIVEGSFYEFAEKKEKKPYYLRYDKGYAWISTEKDAVPANPPEATKEMAPLLASNKDLIGQLTNDAAGIESRKATLKELRKQFDSLVKIRRGEDKNAFELRKLAFMHQLDEGERFLADAEHLTLSWTTTTNQPATGRGEISMSFLPGTGMQKSLEEFAVKPSYFANVQLHQNPVVSGKINFAMDATRIKEAKEFYKAVRPTLETEIDKGDGDGGKKAATKKAMNQFFDMLDAGCELRVIDAFIDANAASTDKNSLVCGIRAADGKAADGILKSLAEMKSGWQVKNTGDEHAGVTIHEVSLPKSRLAAFQKFFAGESVLYVGTSKDAVWGAAGADALKNLKAAIDQTTNPASGKADPAVISYQIQLYKLMQLSEIVHFDPNADKPAKNKDQERARKQLEKYRNLARDTMQGCDSMVHGELRRIDSKMEGFIELNECVLKYIGATMADGIKETLQ